AGPRLLALRLRIVLRDAIHIAALRPADVGLAGGADVGLAADRHLTLLADPLADLEHGAVVELDGERPGAAAVRDHRADRRDAVTAVVAAVLGGVLGPLLALEGRARAVDRAVARDQVRARAHRLERGEQLHGRQLLARAGQLAARLLDLLELGVAD